MVELEDSLLGFFTNQLELTYQEAVMEEDINYYHSNPKKAYVLLMEVEGVANKVSRRIWNLEDALGWAGGIMSILALLVHGSIAPFVANNIPIAISAATVRGRQLQISSYSFLIRKVLESYFSCRCTK